MPYYVRVLSTSSECVPLNQLQFALKPDQGQAILTVEQGTPGDWTQIILSHSDGQEISSIERNVVEEGSLGAAELGAGGLRSIVRRLASHLSVRLSTARFHISSWGERRGVDTLSERL